MSLTWVLIIVALVLGVVVGNIMLLKYSAKFKAPKGFAPKENPYKDKDDEKDSW